MTKRLEEIKRAGLYNNKNLCVLTKADRDWLIRRLESAHTVIKDVLDTDGQPEYVQNMRDWQKEDE